MKQFTSVFVALAQRQAIVALALLCVGPLVACSEEEPEPSRNGAFGSTPNSPALESSVSPVALLDGSSSDSSLEDSADSPYFGEASGGGASDGTDERPLACPSQPASREDCPLECDRCEDGACVIECDDAVRCAGSVVCPSGMACELNCAAALSCLGSGTCPDNHACSLNCIGEDTCQSVVLDCGSGGCAVLCAGDGSCIGAAMVCGSGACRSDCSSGATSPAISGCADSCDCRGCGT